MVKTFPETNNSREKGVLRVTSESRLVNQFRKGRGSCVITGKRDKVKDEETWIKKFKPLYKEKEIQQLVQVQQKE